MEMGKKKDVKQATNAKTSHSRLELFIFIFYLFTCRIGIVDPWTVPNEKWSPSQYLLPCTYRRESTLNIYIFSI